MKIKFLLMLTIISILSNSCKHKLNNVDSFYTDQGDYDAGRIPFIKPYFAVYPTKEVGWSMNLEGKDADLGFFNIKSANVVNGIIFVYSVNSIYHGVNVSQSWHIIIPNKNIEKGFKDHLSYLKYLTMLGVKNEPHLYDMNLIVDYFHEHDIINWNDIK